MVASLVVLDVFAPGSEFLTCPHPPCRAFALSDGAIDGFLRPVISRVESGLQSSVFVENVPLESCRTVLEFVRLRHSRGPFLVTVVSIIDGYRMDMESAHVKR